MLQERDFHGDSGAIGFGAPVSRLQAGTPTQREGAGSNEVSVLLGNGDGSFQAALHFGAGTYSQSVAVGDFNGDRLPDLAVANFGTPPLYLDGSVSVLINNTPQPPEKRAR